MNKKLLYSLLIVLLIVIIVLIGFLYQTFAMSNIVTEENDTYVVNVSDNTSIELPARTSKKVYYKLTNTNDGVVRYGIGYSGTNVEAKVYEDSVDSETGLIDYMENKFIKLKLINNGTTSSTITLSTVLGYENGGDLIVPNGVTLVKNKVKLVNTLKTAESSVSATSNFLDTSLVRNTIETLTITNDNLVSVDALGSFDVSVNGDGTVMLWYTKGTSDNLYNVYIGAEGGKVYFPTSGSYFFAYLSNVVSIDLKYLDATNTTDMTYMFYYCTNLKHLNLSYLKTPKLSYFNNMFNECSSLISLDLSGFDTSKITNFSNLFRNCTSLKEVNLSSFNTSSATTFTNMFMNCQSLQSIDLSNFNTSNVTNMQSMFYNCSSLTTLDLSHFKTSKVTNMGTMFYNCNKLSSLDLSSFDTSKVTNISSMFNSCSLLNNINLSSFNTSNVTDMSNIFYKCSSLVTLDLSNFDTSKVTNMERTFMLCTNLTTIYVSDLWSTTNVTNSNQMFQSSTNIKGSTTYDWSKVDATMANYTTGYLTYKSNN